MKTWPERITDLEALGLSLTEIADRIGASISAVSEIKQGRTKQPRGDTAMKLYALHQERCVKAPKPKKAA
jgi:transcriptional regulator with XRE-family HTH domain